MTLSQNQHIKYQYQYQSRCFRPNYNTFSSTHSTGAGLATIHGTHSGPKLKKCAPVFSHHFQKKKKFWRKVHTSRPWTKIHMTVYTTTNSELEAEPSASNSVSLPCHSTTKEKPPLFFRVSEQLLNIPVWFWRLLCMNFSLSVQSDCACVWGEAVDGNQKCITNVASRWNADALRCVTWRVRFNWT